MVSFWKHIRKENSARVPLATTIGGVTGETDIAEMWQDHYKSILNSVKGNLQQQFVTSKINSISDESILLSTSDINPCPPHHLLLFCSCEPTIWRNFLRIIDIYKN